MKIIEVKDAVSQKQFLELPIKLYENDTNWIRPFDHDVENVFNPKKNKVFKYGEVIRWILIDEQEVIGRIAAFTNPKQYKQFKQPTGGCGFFECINDQKAADLLFNSAKEWLKSKGMQAMDGPNNFGEKDKWWGLLVKGFTPPTYGMNYNFPYYQSLYENYGFQNFYNQYVYTGSTVKGTKSGAKTVEKFKSIANDPDYYFGPVKKGDYEYIIDSFYTVYNSAWGKAHEGFSEMSKEQIRKLFSSIKPILDYDLVWFVTHKGKPVAMFVGIPEINIVVKDLNGKLNWWNKLKFAYKLKFGNVNKAIGIIFGVIPEYQGTSVDAGLFVRLSEYVCNTKYDSYEFNWIGDFNPKMNTILQNWGCDLCKTLVTYRYIFDENIPFERHPVI